MQSTIVISIVGCGGKSTLLKHLALSSKSSYPKILVTTSTKMLKSQLNFADYINVETFEKNGIYTLYNDFGDDKCMTIGYDKLKTIYTIFDLVIIEADGCNCKPIKLVNRQKEPVVYDFTTQTIGVINLNYLDQTLSEDNTFNYNLTQEKVFSKHAINTFIKHSDGLFKNSFGKKVVCFINKEEYTFIDYEEVI